MNLLRALPANMNHEHHTEKPSYFYEGTCPHTNKWLQLPRTQHAEEVAKELMKELKEAPIFNKEGKMYGILLVESSTGEIKVLRAFSGLLQGQADVEGWVPQLPGRERFALEESRVLQELDAHKKELERLHFLPIRSEFQEQQALRQQERQALAQQHKQNKRHRKEQREQFEASLSAEQLASALKQLSAESQQESYERRQLKRKWDEQCAASETEVQAADKQMLHLRKLRKQMSRQLQANMHVAYEVMNFSGNVSSLNALFADGRLPSGTGDCCAPKLLHYAASQQLKPLGLAEFWWGPPPLNESKQSGQFYGACAERCQPIMGFLLSGLPHLSKIEPVENELALHIIYEDEHILVIDKPSGLASVPGRRLAHYDSVSSRIHHLFPELPAHIIVHRLDMETSGILLLVKHIDAHRVMSEAFRKRKVHKQYEAVLQGQLSKSEGEIQLPLGPDTERLPRQKVDWDDGKPSQTHYQTLSTHKNLTRVRFTPITGRTHQLRVHAASAEGLGTPIVGDSLYNPIPGERLLLHACKLQFAHPATHETITFSSKAPF